MARKRIVQMKSHEISDPLIGRLKSGAGDISPFFILINSHFINWLRLTDSDSPTVTIEISFWYSRSSDSGPPSAIRSPASKKASRGSFHPHSTPCSKRMQRTTECRPAQWFCAGFFCLAAYRPLSGGYDAVVRLNSCQQAFADRPLVERAK